MNTNLSNITVQTVFLMKHLSFNTLPADPKFGSNTVHRSTKHLVV